MITFYSNFFYEQVEIKMRKDRQFQKQKMNIMRGERKTSEDFSMDPKELSRKKTVLLEIMASPEYSPMRFKEMANLLQLPKHRREELDAVLESLMQDGKIKKDDRSKYFLNDERIVVGTFLATNRGFGFVRVEDQSEDIFIPQGESQNAMDKDVVKVEITRQKGRQKAEGRIVEILTRATTKLVGIYRASKNFGFVIPDNQKFSQDIYVGNESGTGLLVKNNDKVVVEITDFGDERRKPEGIIVEVLGSSNAVGVDILSIARGFGYNEDFPMEVLQEADGISSTVQEAEMHGREDLRDRLTVTIDGEDAKDLDDAITLRRIGDHWELGVHIADVSHYVKENSPLDIEALHRGTSVYLVDRVIPMLPRKLSNGICSLNAGEDRLSLSCIMELSEKGEVMSHRIVESVIHVNHRMTYTDVNAILTKDASEVSKLYDQYGDAISMFMDMEHVSKLIRNQREKRGAIDFDFPESKVILDESGKVVGIKAYERNAATKLIEDFMLMANETVAEEYHWLELPFLYRIHENPDAQKITQLSTFIHNFGFKLKSKSKDVHPKEMQKLLDTIEGTPAESIISQIMLRSMKQAKYDTQCIGHFGLSAKYYTHFTSPIRRYPDLQIHRIIKENIHRKLNERRIEHYNEILQTVANQSSTTERRAAEAERDSVKYKKCEYIADYIGEEFEGIITGINKVGLFVTLENTVEGFVHVTDLNDDYYEYVEERYEFVGERKKRVYSLGMKVKVKVKDANKFTRTIDMKIVEKVQ